MAAGCPHARCQGQKGGRPKGTKVKQGPRRAATPDEDATAS